MEEGKMKGKTYEKYFDLRRTPPPAQTKNATKFFFILHLTIRSCGRAMNKFR